MGLDRHGRWHPACDLQGCGHDQVDDGVVEVVVLVGDRIRTARIQVCAVHRDQYATHPEPAVA